MSNPRVSETWVRTYHGYTRLLFPTHHQTATRITKYHRRIQDPWTLLSGYPTAGRTPVGVVSSAGNMIPSASWCQRRFALLLTLETILLHRIESFKVTINNKNNNQCTTFTHNTSDDLFDAGIVGRESCVEESSSLLDQVRRKTERQIVSRLALRARICVSGVSRHPSLCLVIGSNRLARARQGIFLDTWFG